MSTAPGQHARHQLDELVHSPVRSSIVTALAQVDEAEFPHVRDTAEISDSVLSQQATQLENAGYVKIRMDYVDNRPRTWLSLTTTGRIAYTRHLQALRSIAEGLWKCHTPPPRQLHKGRPISNHATMSTRAPPPRRHVSYPPAAKAAWRHIAKLAFIVIGPMATLEHRRRVPLRPSGAV